MVKKRKSYRYARKKRSRRKGTQIPIPLVLTAVAPFLRACTGYGKTMIESGDIFGGIQHIAYDTVVEYTGYGNDGFQSKFVIASWVPIGIAFAAHAFLGRKINPYLRRIPMVGKYIGI